MFLRQDGVMFPFSGARGRSESVLLDFAVSSLTKPQSEGTPRPVLTAFSRLLEMAQQLLVDVYNEYFDRPQAVLGIFGVTVLLSAAGSFTLALLSSRN